MSHYRVKHPNELLKGSGGVVKKANDWAAFRLAALYGAALTIWLFAIYSTLGVVFSKYQVTLLYWSNAAQLVFCPLMVYVGNLLDKKAKAKADADHEAMTHIATTADAILEAVKEKDHA